MRPCLKRLGKKEIYEGKWNDNMASNVISRSQKVTPLYRIVGKSTGSSLCQHTQQQLLASTEYLQRYSGTRNFIYIPSSPNTITNKTHSLMPISKMRNLWFEHLACFPKIGEDRKTSEVVRLHSSSPSTEVGWWYHQSPLFSMITNSNITSSNIHIYKSYLHHTTFSGDN